MLRRCLWFASAYTLVIIVHETAHALTGRALGFETRLYQFWVNVESAAGSTTAARSAYGVAGPAASLLLGLAAWLAYRNRRTRASAAAMPLVNLAAFGIGNFCGNLMSTAFIGDFSNVSNWLGLPQSARVTVSILGAIALITVMVVVGRELRRWIPAAATRVQAVTTAVVLPVSIGTALIILVNQPVPIPGFAMARIGESAFWLFAAAGTFMAAHPSVEERADLHLRWLDGAIAALVVALVRVMSLGIAFRSAT